MKKVLIALSGGVDSSVAAALLLEQGCEVMGVTLKTFCYNDASSNLKSCCGLEGVDAARAVAGQLGVPHFVWDVSELFKRDVIDDFVSEYAAGRTPNPCVRCNATVKIPWMLEKAVSMGLDNVATGHYARTVADNTGSTALLRGSDPAKDQSYFLWELPPVLLGKVFFPVGHLSKPEVRAIAQKLGLPNAAKPESQEICFIPDDNYLGFLKSVLSRDHPGFAPGKLVYPDGIVAGKHSGYLGYTVGQRKGIGSHHQKMYVTRINPEAGTVTIGPKEALFSSSMIIGPLNSFVGDLSPRTRLSAQIRHRSKPVPVTIEKKLSDNRLLISFEQPATAVTPGQSAALYDEDRLVGGARIISTR